MSGKGCGGGCLSLVGLTFLLYGWAGLHSNFAPLGWFFLTAGAVPLALAVALFRGAAADARRRAEWLAGQEERLVLQAALRHRGRLTPTMVAVSSAGITIARAREILDRLAREQVCGLESDDRGNVYYVFDLGQLDPLHEEPLEAEEWVRRMTGGGAREGSVDA